MQKLVQNDHNLLILFLTIFFCVFSYLTLPYLTLLSNNDIVFDIVPIKKHCKRLNLENIRIKSLFRWKHWCKFSYLSLARKSRDTVLKIQQTYFVCVENYDRMLFNATWNIKEEMNSRIEKTRKKICNLKRRWI